MDWTAVKRLRILILLALTCVVFQFTPIYEHLIYRRDDILSGDWWLVLSGNFVHLGTSHLVMNFTGLTLVIALIGDNYSEPEWIFIGLISSLAVGVGLLAFVPWLQAYVGLSGMIHGLLIAGCLIEWRRSGLFGLMIAGVSVGKLVYEQIYGAMPGSEETAGGPVIVDSHLFGAIGGLIAGGLVLLLRLLKRD
ncbi:MAG: rhombosortase [Gammaproteobacteria bacterium]|nr:rhombosortase [Gammaproteobacteria bacterium]